MIRRSRQPAPGDYFIFSPSEYEFDGAGYWSNRYGWAEHNLATPFTQDERAAFNLPLPNDARWVPY